MRVEPLSAATPRSPDDETPADACGTPGHAVDLPGGSWRLWRSAVLRGAGFPARLVRMLADEREAEAATRYCGALAEVRRCRAEMIAALTERLRGADAVERRRIRRLRRAIERDERTADGEDERFAALGRARDERRRAQSVLVEAIDRTAAASEVRLRDLAAEPRFQCALLWQGREPASIVLRRMRDGSGSPAERRSAVEHLAMRVQRYAVKNDTIGFFGPVGWMSITNDPGTVALAPGPDVIDGGEVYFESWCVTDLIDRLNADPRLRVWAAPRLRGGVWRGRDGYVLPVRGPAAVSPFERRVLDLCDGRRTAAQVADALAPAACEADVFATLAHLVDEGLLTWRFDVAPQLYPERELATRLERIGDAALRDRCLQSLNALVSARAAVADARGDPERLERSLARLEQTFTELTERRSTRRHGQAYAARNLVYEDCRRDCAMTLGRGCLEAIGPPLSLVLDSARWAAGELAAAVRTHVRYCFAQLSAGGAEVDAQRLLEHGTGAGTSYLAAVEAALRQRYQAAWRQLLRLDMDAPRQHFHLGDLADRARHLFAASGPIWSRARYFSPDVMIAGAGIDAVRRGAFHGVLGELHVDNTLLASALISQHPDPDAIVAALDADARGTVCVVVPRGNAEAPSRVRRLCGSTAWRYEQGGHLPHVAPGRSLPAGLLVAVDDGQRVVIRARDGSVEFDGIELFGHALCSLLNGIIAHRLADAPHSPRVTIDALTIARETWRVRPGHLPCLQERDPYVQFALLRQWARDRGMPRDVFYRSPLEQKPCFLDFDSAIYARLFLKMMRQLHPDHDMQIVEMLPAVDDLWLHDRAGEQYSCEIRIAARCD